MGDHREPGRSCVGCRGTAPRRELLRVVRGADGTVGLDPGATAAGRGAWLHRDRDCVAAALRKGALAKALRTGLAADEVGRLRERIEGELGTA